jgi:hypothetical protein
MSFLSTITPSDFLPTIFNREDILSNGANGLQGLGIGAASIAVTLVSMAALNAVATLALGKAQSQYQHENPYIFASMKVVAIAAGVGTAFFLSSHVSLVAFTARKAFEFIVLSSLTYALSGRTRPVAFLGCLGATAGFASTMIGQGPAIVATGAVVGLAILMATSTNSKRSNQKL